MSKPIIRNKTERKPLNAPEELEDAAQEEEAEAPEEEVSEPITGDSTEDCGCPELAEEECLSVVCPRMNTVIAGNR